MATNHNNHRNHRRLSVTERAFWREVFVACIKRGDAVKKASDVADDSMHELRARMAWSRP